MNPRATFRLTAPSTIAAACAIACAIFLATDPAGRALAQETDLPGVSADSVHRDFLSGTHAAPAVPGAPAAPGVTGAPEPLRTRDAPDDPQTTAFRRRMHAGDNDVVQLGEDVVVERGEHVLGHVFAMGGNVTIRGMVDDDVVAMGGDVTLEDGATVRGDVVSLGGMVHKATGATVLGSNVTVGGLPKRLFDFRTLDLLGNGMRFLTAITNLLFGLFIGWIVILLSATRSRRVLDRMEPAFGASIGWGFVGVLALAPATIAVVLVAVLLVVTIIGIPVAAILLLGYVVAVVALLLWGGVLGATAIGDWIVRRLAPSLGEPTLMRSMLIGFVAMGVLGLVGPLFRAMGIAIPPAALLGGLLSFVGGTIKCLALLAGFGGLLRARAGQVDPIRIPWGARMAPVMPAVPPAPPAAPVPPQ